ncbi:hypothetical protein TNCV_623731 [Trichonephila clavipes]|nr:hypothetical protein TNCV_623731 [Trichonephila clavipes]
MEGGERWETSSQHVLPQNKSGTESKRIVICMVLKTVANARQFRLWCQCDWTYNSLAMWTRSLPGQLTVALHLQWRIVIKDGKMATVVFGASVGHLQVCEETRGEDDWRIMRHWALMS